MADIFGREATVFYGDRQSITVPLDVARKILATGNYPNTPSVVPSVQWPSEAAPGCEGLGRVMGYRQGMARKKNCGCGCNGAAGGCGGSPLSGMGGLGGLGDVLPLEDVEAPKVMQPVFGPLVQPYWGVPTKTSTADPTLAFQTTAMPISGRYDGPVPGQDPALGWVEDNWKMIAAVLAGVMVLSLTTKGGRR